MPLNVARYKAKQKETESGGDSGDIMRLKPGKNYVRIFKFRHTVTKRDFDLKLYRKGQNAPEIGSVVEELARPYEVHLISGTSPINCFLNKKDCEHCEEAKDLLREGSKQAGRQLRAQERNAMNVVDMNNSKEGMKRLDLSPQPYGGVLEQYFSKIEDGVEEDDIFGCNGRDFIIEYNKGSADVSKIYGVTIRDKERSDKLPEGLQAKTKDFYRAKYLDPQDAPPVDEDTTTKEDGDKCPWEDKPKEQPKSAEKLKDEPSRDRPESLIGCTIEFDDGGKSLMAKIREWDGSQWKALDENGEAWAFDRTEKFIIK